MQTPVGFSFAGVPAGLKPVRRDVALVVSDTPCVAAGAFTTNLAAAAPVLDARPRVPASSVRAVVVNSGNANALTGAAGVADVVAIREAFGRALGVGSDAVLTASTGVIGVRLPVGKVVDAAGKLVAALSPAPELAAEAIMTTDTRTKLSCRQLQLGGRTVTISAIAKGSGMIMPQLATMITVVTTDAAIAPALLDRALAQAIEPSFHCLVVDGDTSTNDSIFVLANGRAGNPPITDPGADYDAFAAALTSLCVEIARDIASDGEGATRLLEVSVSGAPSTAVARDLARSIAASSLVKAAIFGADPNWGRVLATVGARAGSQGFAVDPHQATVAIQGMTVFAGEPVLADPPALRAKMRAPEVRVEVALGAGQGSATAWGCDLGYDYVKINADYTSLIVQTKDGGLAKDDRLTNYSPSFKRTLLVEALSYISRFAGTRCVVCFRGAAMEKPALAQAFCKDIELLRSCGLAPIVVHGHAPQSLVTLLNLDGGHAIGLAGNDAGLLRVKQGTLTVSPGVAEVLLGQGYVPVIKPVALGDDGLPHPIEPDAAAAALAVALGVPKLILLGDAQGILEHGELVTDLHVPDLDRAQETGGIAKDAIRTALAGGVGRVHVIDGRTPHTLIAELFTDRGVGTLVTP
ncbi:MAG TPA: bifunctional glutamate N-acetyltransferase/amino-acid acetyltransferase ArgJ [Kofleriaceae bacterium]|nr:bifunctional glutamate N-acetyltransferase/amino-acid acetyltransferase ArgJ [Kofleriaceae bacterium]